MDRQHFSNTSNTSTSTTYPLENDVDDGGSDNEATQDWGSFADSNFVLALYGIICVVGIVGNLLVAIVLLRVPSLRSNTSDFLIHLSLIDFIVCVLVIPFKLVPTTGKSLPNPGFFGELRCRLYVGQYIFWVCALISILGLVTVNLERFIAIVYPHKYKVVLTRRNKYFLIASCWMFAVLSKSFILFLYGEDEVVGCHFLGWPSKGVQAGVGLFSFTVTLFAPFALMILVQWKVITTLKRQVKIVTCRLASSAHNPADQREMWQLRATKTLMKTLLSFVITFAICWGPSQIIFLLYNFGVYVDFASPLYHCSVILSVCNSCVNPVLYTAMNQPFRKGIREVFCRGKNTGQVGASDQGTSGTAPVTTRTEAF